MDNQNKNPIINTILLFVIGIAGLCLLFGFLSGNGFGMNPSMMGNSDMMGGNPASMVVSGSTLISLLTLLIKLFTIALAIIFLIGATIWLKDTFFKNASFGFKKLADNDPIMRIIVYGSLATLGLALILALLGQNSNTSMSMHNMTGMVYSNQPYGFTALIGMLIKLFTFILVASLSIAAIIYIKKQFEQGGTIFHSSLGNCAKPEAQGFETKDLEQIKFSGEAAGETQINKRDK